MREKKRVVVKMTAMKELPPNCYECTEQTCRIPEMKTSQNIYKVYLKRRHAECPLKVMDDVESEKR